MRIVFAGTPVFAQVAYQAIIEAGFDVCGILTQPDRRSGRGMKLMPSPVKQYALEQAIVPEIIQVQSLRLDGRYPDQAQQAYDSLKHLNPDVIVVVAYGLILPQWVLDLPRFGCLNIHASLLPRWRGAAPIHRAIEAQDEKTGVAIMQMTAGLDEGDVLLEKVCRIGLKNTAQLHDELATLGAEGIVEILHQLKEGRSLVGVPQSSEGVCYAHKIEKSEAVLDFSLGADQLAAKVRAFNPFPGANCALEGLEERIKIWDAEALMSSDALNKAKQYKEGQVIGVSSEGIDLATGVGILRLLELQRPNGKRQPVSVFAPTYQQILDND